MGELSPAAVEWGREREKQGCSDGVESMEGGQQGIAVLTCTHFLTSSISLSVMVTCLRRAGIDLRSPALENKSSVTPRRVFQQPPLCKYSTCSIDMAALAGWSGEFR